MNTADSLGKWLVLFFYPKDFTTVCPTELRAFSERAHEFAALGCDVMAVSTDTAESHKAWIDMPAELGGLGTCRAAVGGLSCLIVSTRSWQGTCTSPSSPTSRRPSRPPMASCSKTTASRCEVSALPLLSWRPHS